MISQRARNVDKRGGGGLWALVITVGLAAASAGLGGVGFVASAAGSARSTGGISPLILVGPVIHSATAQPPPSSALCFADFGINCYGPQDMYAEYNYPNTGLGTNGSGQTIAIFDSFGSPTIQSDLNTFDTEYGLPAISASGSPWFQEFEPEGQVTLNYNNLPSPAGLHNKNIANEIGWAYETSLDVEYAHAMAPGANIALVTIPIPETQGVQGLTNMENAQRWVLQNHPNWTIWSNSWATTEQAFNNSATIENLDSLYATAAADGVSAFFASGDSGVANTDKQGRLFDFPTVNYPSSSPNVVSVGGTQINNAGGAQITTNEPESVWNDGYGAGGGGYSTVFGEPADQSLSAIPDSSGARGLPDVAYNAAVVSAVNVYESFDPAGAGWALIGGTSAATPQWAAIDAIANQYDGNLGFVAPRLYDIYRGVGGTSYAADFHDITTGNNSFAGITGYSAGPGWDAASGLGTPNVANLIADLAKT